MTSPGEWRSPFSATEAATWCLELEQQRQSARLCFDSLMALRESKLALLCSKAMAPWRLHFATLLTQHSVASGAESSVSLACLEDAQDLASEAAAKVCREVFSCTS